MLGVVQMPRLPAVKPALWSVVPGGGAGISKLGEIPGAAQVALRATARGRVKLLLRGYCRVTGTGAAAGRLFPGRLFVQPSGRLCGFRRPARGRAFPIWEISRTTHAAFSRNCPWALRTAASWANDGFSETGCAGLWLRPSLSSRQAGLGVFPSPRVRISIP